MNVEIINTSPNPIPNELEAALIAYAPYHEFQVQRNRIGVDTELYFYDIRCAFVEVDEDHIAIWMSDWYRKLREK